MSDSTQARTYDRSRGVVFHKTRDAFGQLSNMCSGFPLTVSGVTVPSSEALYQACRFPHLPEVQKQIIAQKSPMTAKMITKPYRQQTRSDWDDIRVPVMKWCLRVKLVQHWASIGAVLQSTGNRPIIEQSRKDAFWGAIPTPDGGELRGANVLGRLLMELRKILKENPSELNVITPVAIPEFCLLGRSIEPIARLRLVPSAAEPLQLVAPDQAPTAARPKARKKASGSKKSAATSQLPMFADMATKQARINRSTQAVTYHVVASKRGGWDVIKDGAKRVSAHFETKAPAIEKSRALATRHKADLTIHDKTGKPLQVIKFAQVA